MLIKNGREHRRFNNVGECNLAYKVNHCYSTSFTNMKGNKITAHWNSSSDFNDISFKNEELVVTYLSSMSGKHFVGYVGPVSETERVFVFKPYSIGTCISSSMHAY